LCLNVEQVPKETVTIICRCWRSIAKLQLFHLQNTYLTGNLQSFSSLTHSLSVKKVDGKKLFGLVLHD